MNKSLYRAHKNFDTKSCMFTAPDAHSACMYRLSQAKTTKRHAHPKVQRDLFLPHTKSLSPSFPYSVSISFSFFPTLNLYLFLSTHWVSTSTFFFPHTQSLFLPPTLSFYPYFFLPHTELLSLPFSSPHWASIPTFFFPTLSFYSYLFPPH